MTPLVLLAGMLSCGRGNQRTVGSPPPPTSSLRQVAATHNITMGTAAFSPFLAEPSYAAILGSEFSQLQAENEMKFGPIHPHPGGGPSSYDFSGGDALVAFAQAHSMVVRGHTLVWHRQVPLWVTRGGYTAAQLATVLEDHINTVMGHYAGKVYAWDVVNEAFNDNGGLRPTMWYDQPGIGFAGQGTKYVEQALQWAHAADPTAKLFYNDYNGEIVNPKSDAIYAMVAEFKRRAVPLDGVGFQMHIDLSFANPATLASFSNNLGRFAALGLTLHITEMDVRLSDASPASLSGQAKLYGEITAICVRQPSCKLIQTWGFTDKHSWIPEFYPGQGWALLWDANYQKKPAYAGVHEALRR
jgi:endo-1,4-beta-xylanase